MTMPLHVLLVEDAAEDAALMLDALARAGFEVTATRVETEPEMSAALERGPWDLILCDFTLPRFDGEHALQLSIARAPDVPVIVVTGTIAEERLADVMRAGARDFVLKDRLERLAPAVQRELAAARARVERRRLEAQLQGEQERFRALVEKSPEPVTVTDAEGRVLYASPSIGQLFDYDHDEYSGHSIFDFLYPTEGGPGRAEITEFISTRHSPFIQEVRCLRKDGGRRWIEVSGSNFLDDPRVGGLVFAYRDVTDRKIAEGEKQRARERAEALLELLQNPSRSIDEIMSFTIEQAVKLTDSVLGFIGFVTEDDQVLAARMSGATRSQCGMKSDVTIEFNVAQGGLWKAPLHERRPVFINDYAAEHPMKKGLPPGHPPVHRMLGAPVLRSGRAVMLIGVANKTDPYNDADLLNVQIFAEGVWRVIENARQTETLRRNERYYRALTERSLDLVAVIDANGAISYQSLSAEHALGWPVAQMKGRAFLDFVQDEDRERVATLFSALAPGATEKALFRMRHRDGGSRTIEAIVRHLLHDPDVAGIVVNSRDVTDRKELETQYLHAQKLDAFGQLAGGVAHDFNNILAVMLMNFSLLQLEPDVPGPVAMWLKELELLAHRAAGLTRQLLIFSRKQELSIQTVDLNAVIKNVCGMLQRVIGENISFEFRPAAAPLWIQADAGMLEQVATNLCVNARDAMPQGGHLTVTLSADRSRLSSDPAGAPLREVACLAITDTGCGMDANTRKHLFEPFFTTKPPGHGTGLGLATVHSIATQHHGWVEVDSAPGCGSTLRVYFPRTTSAVPESAPASSPTPVLGGKETVLLVEDEPLVRTTLGLCLRRGGYKVVEAQNGASALASWKEHEGKFDLLVSDMIMPGGISGLQLASQLLVLKPTLRVVIVSGYSAEPIGATTPHTSHLVHLAKPCSPEQLLKTVRTVLDAS